MLTEKHSIIKQLGLSPWELFLWCCETLGLQSVSAKKFILVVGIACKDYVAAIAAVITKPLVSMRLTNRLINLFLDIYLSLVLEKYYQSVKP